MLERLNHFELSRPELCYDSMQLNGVLNPQHYFCLLHLIFMNTEYNGNNKIEENHCNCRIHTFL